MRVTDSGGVVNFAHSIRFPGSEDVSGFSDVQRRQSARSEGHLRFASGSICLRIPASAPSIVLTAVPLSWAWPDSGSVAESPRPTSN